MQVLEGLDWVRIYYVRGTMPKGARLHYAVKDPPTSGWQHAIVIRGEKRSTIFCPFTFDAWTVRNDCAELETCLEDVEFRPDWFAEFMPKKWTEFQSFGWNKDYDTAALVLKRMNLPVPEQLLKGGEEDTRKKGGKEVAAKLLKVVKKASKRGKFLDWFLSGDGPRSIREAMAEFSMTRSNALSYLHMINKDHGIGYELVGDTASIVLPKDCANPFDVKEDGDDGWLD